MSRSLRRGAGALALALVLPACKDTPQPLAQRTLGPAASPSFTAASGSVSTLLGRATFVTPGDETFKVKRITGDWHVEVKAKSGLDVAVQNIVFPAGSHSGWHSHPGPVFIQVVEGTMTFYESHDPTCTPIVRRQGEGYLDVGDHAHIARNETNLPSRNVVTYLAPPGAALRIDQPAPGNCPF
jgi:hypothetical protein